MAIVKGTDALKPAEKDNNSGNSSENEDRVLRYLKKDEAIRVRLLGAEEFARVPVYDIYPLTGTIGIPKGINHFEEGKKILFANADKIKKDLDVDAKRTEMTDVQFKAFKEGEGSEWVAALKEAYRLDQESRFLFGFVDLETGKPFLLQATEKQAPLIQKTIQGMQGQADSFAFAVSKATGGFSIMPDFATPLTEAEKKIIEESRGLEIPVELFEEAHFSPSEVFQLEVLKQMGHFEEYLKTVKPEASSTDGQASKPEETGEPLDIQDDALPF
ncbi:hypothetical protein [Bacillus thuringiensis]|uniref:hypothetical protein n=1 Tax=Bacillus thuringiensis TaxID=1428 RepID=UPI000BF85811|nr:hypothetical protein [Bacillus thuringiensis]PFA41984.1 hypothetical protein CN416_04325 [Bacillus thuringiensis]